MADRPIIFSDAMVRAILDGSKTQTRRMRRGDGWQRILLHKPDGVVTWADIDRKGAPEIGDRLWVREAWAVWLAADLPCINYRASCGTGKDGLQKYTRLRPSDISDMSGKPRRRLCG